MFARRVDRSSFGDEADKAIQKTALPRLTIASSKTGRERQRRNAGRGVGLADGKLEYCGGQVHLLSAMTSSTFSLISSHHLSPSPRQTQRHRHRRRSVQFLWLSAFELLEPSPLTDHLLNSWQLAADCSSSPSLIKAKCTFLTLPIFGFFFVFSTAV